jgi:hypothetical protein
VQAVFSVSAKSTIGAMAVGADGAEIGGGIGAGIGTGLGAGEAGGGAIAGAVSGIPAHWNVRVGLHRQL